MITNFSLQEIISQSSPQQKMLWNDIFFKFGDTVPVRQFVYDGPIGGSEFLTYNAKKYYYAYNLDLSYYGAVLNSPGFVELHDENDTITLRVQNLAVSYNVGTSVQQYLASTLALVNYRFSRVIVTSYSYIRFIGFKIGA